MIELHSSSKRRVESFSVCNVQYQNIMSSEYAENFNNEMMAHSVNTFRNFWVVHDLSTSKDYSTI